MWLIIILFIGPIVYLIVSGIGDSISYEVKKTNREKYHGEEIISFFSTNDKKNISKEDIMLLFVSLLKKYKRRYFMIEYSIFNDKEDQNGIWAIKTTKQTFGWGIVYNIRFIFSNGYVHLSFSNNEFLSGEKISLEYYLGGMDLGTNFIESTLNSCRDEAEIIWKINGIKSEGNLPFDYIPLSDSNRSSSNGNGFKSQKEKSSYENATQIDLISFYRNLLGLKLCFSQEELKKSYREAVGKYHPDRYGSSSPRDRENAELLMKQVNEAYEKLKEMATK
jgi:hypothetical protein